MSSRHRARSSAGLHASADPATGGAPGTTALVPRPRAATRHHQSDQLSKSILRDALGCASAAETEVEVLAATQRIDVYAVPDPARAAERGKMGLLGELSVEPSLFEPFRNTPSLRPVRRILCKQLTWHHELERRGSPAEGATTVEDDSPPSGVPFPWLVVISLGRPRTVLDAFGCRRVRRGVYEAVKGLQMRIVVLAELPRARETLLLRLLGAGRLLAHALDDLAALPADAWERGVVMPLLVHFRLPSDGKQAPNEEEDDVSAEIRDWFDGYQQDQQKLRNEARDAGRAEEAARAVLTVLRVRGVAVPDGVRERILAETDTSLLERWLERAAVAVAGADVVDEPS